jgi:DUF4097 and DUF4098 domain-containing protein YvlB
MWMWMPLAANAAAPVDQERPVSPNLNVTVSMACGSLAITGAELPTVKVSGTVDRADALNVETSAGAVDIEVAQPICAMLTVRVPRGASLAVETLHAPVTVQGLTGALALESLSGSLTVEADCANLQAETISGAVTARGNIRRSALSTVSGPILADRLSGSVALETVSGSVRIAAGGPLDELSAESVSGPITAAAHLATRARVVLESHSGAIVFAMPPTSDATLSAESATGRITSAFGATGGRELVTTLGTGTALVVIETYSGPITVSRLEGP